MPQIETIELMPDERMVTAEGRTGRIMVFDHIERAWRGTPKLKPWISTEHYQIVRQIQTDAEMAQAFGVGALDIKVDGGRADWAIDDAHDAAGRLRRCSGHVGYKRAWTCCTAWIGGEPLRRIERRICLRNGEAKRGVLLALDRIQDAQIYETRRYRTSTWAAMENAA